MNGYLLTCLAGQVGVHVIYLALIRRAKSTPIGKGGPAVRALRGTSFIGAANIAYGLAFSVWLALFFVWLWLIEAPMVLATPYPRWAVALVYGIALHALPFAVFCLVAWGLCTPRAAEYSRALRRRKRAEDMWAIGGFVLSLSVVGFLAIDFRLWAQVLLTFPMILYGIIHAKRQVAKTRTPEAEAANELFRVTTLAADLDVISRLVCRNPEPWRVVDDAATPETWPTSHAKARTQWAAANVKSPSIPSSLVRLVDHEVLCSTVLWRYTYRKMAPWGVRRVPQALIDRADVSIQLVALMEMLLFGILGYFIRPLWLLVPFWAYWYYPYRPWQGSRSVKSPLWLCPPNGGMLTYPSRHLLTAHSTWNTLNLGERVSLSEFTARLVAMTIILTPTKAPEDIFADLESQQWMLLLFPIGTVRRRALLERLAELVPTQCRRHHDTILNQAPPRTAWLEDEPAPEFAESSEPPVA